MAIWTLQLPSLALILAAYSLLWSPASANYTLEIMVHGYRNPTHLSLGQASFRLGCCEGDRTLPCSPCDNAFRFCVGTGRASEPCDVGLVKSQLITEDNDDLTFGVGDAMGGLGNPLIFSGYMWPGMVDILFTVYDLDGTVSISPSSDIVDNIFFAPQLEAVQFRNSSFTPVMTYMGNYSMLDLSFRLICGEDHYGPQCVFCVDTNNTSGHYTCDSSGKKVCLEGYQNSTANCIECVPAEDCDPKGGYCTEPGECVCKEGFKGHNCSDVIHPCFRNCVKGTCHNATNDTNMYVCECLLGYEGVNCDQETNACSKNPCVNGNCTLSSQQSDHMNYICECMGGYEGKNCETEKYVCSPEACGESQQCGDSGECECKEGYMEVGDTCEPSTGSEDVQSSGPNLLVIVVAVVGIVLVILISAVFFAILFLLCRKRQMKSEEGVPNPYETPSHYLSTHNGGPNGVEKNFDNPLYTEGSVSPPLPPRIEHPYATLEGAQERYESISVSPTDEKTSQKKENPYLDPVNPMNSSTVVYAHIQ